MGFTVGDSREGSQVPMFQLHGGSAERLPLLNASDAPPMIPDDWRAHLPPHDRTRIVVKIMETLKKHIPQVGFQELNRIALKFEEKTYSASTTLPEYLKKISLTMLTMGGKSQSQIANSLQTNASRNSSDLGNMGQNHYQHPMTGTVGLMDGNLWTGTQALMVQPQAGTVEQLALSSSGGAPPMDPDDWRAKVPHESRQRVLNKILETLKRLIPVSGREGLQDLQNLALRFEKKIYFAAKSQADYLKRICVQLLTMETKSQTQMANSLQTGAASHSMQSQIHNQGRAMPIEGGQNSLGNSMGQGVQQQVQQNRAHLLYHQQLQQKSL